MLYNSVEQWLRKDIISTNLKEGDVAKVSTTQANQLSVRGGLCSLEGPLVHKLRDDVLRVFGTVGRTIFETSKPGRVTLYEWFMVELAYTLDYMVHTDKPEHRSSVPLVAQEFLKLLKVSWINSSELNKRVDARRIARMMTWKPLDYQQEFFDFYDYATSKGQLTGALANFAPGLGKCLRNDQRVLSWLTGWVDISDLMPGDNLVGSNGKKMTVTGVYPQGVRPMNMVTFEDGTISICDDDHLWTVTLCPSSTATISKSYTLTTEYLKSKNEAVVLYKIPHMKKEKGGELTLAKKWKRIKSIVQIEPAEATCIKVSAEDNLFITEGYNLTHNTYTGLAVAAGLKEVKRVIIIAPKVAFTDPWINSIRDLHIDKKHKVYVINRRPPKGDERFLLCNYDSLKRLYSHLRRLKKVYTLMLLDESHNLNEMSAKRTHVYIELCKEFVNEAIHLSGTPIKANIKELIPLLTVIDKRFVPEVAKKFHKAMPVHGTIINNRMKRLSLTVEKGATGRSKPKSITLMLKTKNGLHYTIEAIKLRMKEYAIKRLKYWTERRPQSMKTYNELINKVKVEDEQRFKEFHRHLEIIMDTDRYSDINDSIRNVSEYESEFIIPFLSSEDKKEFRIIRAAAKYPKLKVLGETLGIILGGARRECSVELSGHLRVDKVAANGTGKVLVFSNHVAAASSMYDQSKKLGMNPLLIHSNNYKEGDRPLNTDPNALDKVVHIFRNDPNANPLCTTYPTLSTAVPLTMVSEVVILDSPFREYILSQAIARADRLGNDHKVTVHFVMLDTAEAINITDRNLDLSKMSGEYVANVLDIDQAVAYPDG
jgi:hypothetical protein